MNVSTIGAALKDMTSGTYDFTDDGKCTQCGQCCGSLLPLKDVEVRKIKKYIKEHNIKACKHFLPLAHMLIDLTCPFLDTGKKVEKCRIYDVRPLICRAYCCNKETIDYLSEKELLSGDKATIVNMWDFFKK